jgi:hypothetical protein
LKLAGSGRRVAGGINLQSDEKMVVISRYGDVRQAEIALSVLTGVEIEGFIDVPYAGSLFPHIMFQEGVALYVRDSDAERATAILNDVIAPFDDDEERDHS